MTSSDGERDQLRISELSERAGVALPTVKFYLREGLLPPGRVTGPNQARYGDRHLRRLRLIRSMVEVGGLPLAAVRQVLAAVDDETVPVHDAFGIVQDALSPSLGVGRHQPGRPVDGTEERAAERAAIERDVDTWLRRRKWRVRSATPARDELVDALVALRGFDWPVGVDVFDRYAELVEPIAEAEVAFIDATQDRGALMEGVVVGTVVFERVLGAVRRLALEHHSARRFPRRRSG